MVKKSVEYKNNRQVIKAEACGNTGLLPLSWYVSKIGASFGGVDVGRQPTKGSNRLPIFI